MISSAEVAITIDVAALPLLLKHYGDKDSVNKVGNIDVL